MLCSRREERFSQTGIPTALSNGLLCIQAEYLWCSRLGHSLHTACIDGWESPLYMARTRQAGSSGSRGGGMASHLFGERNQRCPGIRGCGARFTGSPTGRHRLQRNQQQKHAAALLPEEAAHHSPPPPGEEKSEGEEENHCPLHMNP